VKTKLINIEGKQIGIVGLDEVFEELYQEGQRSDASLKDYLLTRFKAVNYIPSQKGEVYASCFLDEYRKFCDHRKTGAKETKKNLKPWRGVQREEIPWFPTIMEKLCDGCRICLRFCSFGVYEYDEETNKVKVANPFNCEVECSMCALKCKPKAISFPPLTILESFRR
jgi:NAD-dependent dihydropyrimidine dehydrogenase PreA subunit